MEFDGDLLVPIVMFISLAVVFCFLFYFRYKNRAEIQTTVRHALQQGQQLTPELLEKLGQPVPSGDADLRRGAIAIAIALGFSGLAFGIGEEDALGPMLGVASFPLLIGLAYLAFWWFSPKG